MKNSFYTYKAHGTLTGLIWQGMKCEKDFNLTLSRYFDKPFVKNFGTLAELRELICKDRDFERCEILEGCLVITLHYSLGNSKRMIQKVIEL
jgi:hypothetical protein